MRSSDEECSPVHKRQKGIRHEDQYKRNVIKKAKVSGEEHLNWVGKTVPAKSPASNACSCKTNNCLSSYSEEDMIEIFSHLHGMETKTEQDIYIQSLMEILPVERNRARPGSTSEKPRSFNVKYHILHGGTRTKVCKDAFIKTYGYSSKQCYRLSHLLQVNEKPTDNRGKNVSGNSIPGSVLSRMRSHIESYPTKSHHYTGKEKKYLAANLNLKIMHEMFIKKESDFLMTTLRSEKRLSYKFFWSYFHENYPEIGFGQPVKDACVTCEELNLKIRNPSLNDNAKRVAVAELLVHKRKAKKFYTALNEITNRCLTMPSETAGICIDFMANISLPCIPVQDTYYLRQLTVNTFGIHDLATRQSTIFIYHEGEGGKGANEVCTMINWYIENKINSDVKNFYIFGDNCAGQNKNNTMIRMIMHLCETKKFDEVKLIFPVRGHSFMPNDRDFGIIRRKLRREERYYTMEEVVELIRKSSKNPDKFSIVKMEHNDFLDYSSWWPKFYKKTCLSDDSYGKSVPKNMKRSFMISKYRELSVSASNSHSVLCNTNISGLTSDTFRLRNSVETFELPSKKAYSTVLPINACKMDDIKKTLVYIPEDKMTFWNSIIAWPTSTTASDENLNE